MNKIFALILAFALVCIGCSDAIDKTESSNKIGDAGEENMGFYQLIFDAQKLGKSNSTSVLWGTSNFGVSTGGLLNGQNLSDAAVEYDENAIQISYIAYDNALSNVEAEVLLRNVITPYLEEAGNTSELELFEISGCPAVKAQYFRDAVDCEYFRVFILTKNHCYSIMQYRKTRKPSDEMFVEAEKLIAGIEIRDEDKYPNSGWVYNGCAHTWEEKVLKKATAEASGEKQYSCKECGCSYTEKIPMLEVAPTIPSTQPPTSLPTEPIKKIEILFRDISWGATSEEVKQTLEDNSINAHIWEKTSIYYPEALLNTYSFDSVYEGGNVINLYNITAGGYDVYSAQLQFAYTVQDGKVDRDKDSFYAAVYNFDVVEYDAAYKDLQHKMVSLYGEGKESSQTKTAWIASADYSGEYQYVVKQTTWYGKNNTFVTLQSITSDNKADSVQMYCGLSMLYGKTNADTMLDKLGKALTQEKADAEKENAAGNSDGL